MSDPGRIPSGSRDDDTVDASGAPPDDDPIDRLAEEFAERCRRGESPSIGEYAARHPEHASRIRELLPTVAMMEQLKRSSHVLKGRDANRPAPERLGEFRILRELGRGGMGVVYEAVQEPLGRHIALKVIHQVPGDPRRLLRFRREAQAVAQLHHTNIVPIFAVGEHEGLPYYAMQYIRGEGLDAILARWREAGPVRPEDAPGRWRFAARVGLQAAEAIQHAHDQGVLHRDIKPANLLIDADGAVWVTDFGLAKIAGHDDLTASGDVIGTLRYLAPESLHGVTGPRGDVYSLGLTLYEMLTLHPPFGDLTPSEMLHRVGEGRLARPRAFDPSIPRDLETIVLKAIAREPDHRYPTAGALAEDLRRFLEDRPILARRATAAEKLWRWSRRNRSTAALSAVAASALLLAAVVGWAGFAREAEARRKADETTDTILAFLGGLVDQFSAKEEAARLGPGPPPPAGPWPGMPGEPPGGPFARPPGPPGNPMMTADSEMIRSIIRFYDRLAEKTETVPKRRAEAAWALFKIGGYDERTRHPDEAARECDRALAIFEDLAAKYPETSQLFAKLAMFPDMVSPEGADEASLKRMEKRLRRIRALLDRLAATQPENPALDRARMRGRMKLGLVLGGLKRSDEAERECRAAIDQAGRLLAKAPGDQAARVDLLEARFALARLRLIGEQGDPAWDILREAAAEVEDPDKPRIVSTVIADHLESFEAYFRLRKQGHRADELQRWSDIVDPRPPVVRTPRPTPRP